MDILEWLQEWYKSNCDGYWEEMYGIKIHNVDNPGWFVEIGLLSTDLEEKYLEDFKYDNDEDWMFCIVRDGVFRGSGDENKLEKILLFFKNWATSN